MQRLPKGGAIFNIRHGLSQTAEVVQVTNCMHGVTIVAKIDIYSSKCDQQIQDCLGDMIFSRAVV
jgi:hypothetical protein